MSQFPESGKDLLLWQKASEGKKEALGELYEIYFENLYDYGMRLCANSNMVSDAIQDIFVHIWERREKLSILSSIRAYLFTSLRNDIFNKIKLDKRKTEREAAFLRSLNRFELKYSVEEAFIRKESERRQSDLIKQAVESLTPRQKECIYLRFYSEMSFEEIAFVMGSSIKAVYKLKGRSIDALKKHAGKIAFFSTCFPFSFFLS